MSILGPMTDLVIPRSVLEAARLSTEELRREIAVLLYERRRLTLAQAARLAEMDRYRFQHLLASREIDLSYDEDDLLDDLRIADDFFDSDGDSPHSGEQQAG